MMIRRFEQRIINCINHIRSRFRRNNQETRGQEIDQGEITIRNLAKKHCKNVKKDSDPNILGLIKFNENQDIEILEIGVYDKDESNINCLICLEKIDYRNDIRFIQGCCKQVYHIECIQKWVLDNHKCPVCKETLLVYNC